MGKSDADPTPPTSRQPARQAPSDRPAADGLPSPTLCIAFDELAKGRKEVQIEFGGQTYRLRVTRNGKLILNK